MNAGVILAAGDSTRMGFPKQLAEVKDKPLLELVIEKVNSYFESSTVVLGSENEIIEEKINFYNSNILINEKGALVPIDFGIMGRLSNKDRQFLALLLIHLLNKNYKKVVEIHSQANMLNENISHNHLAQAIRAISTPILNKPIGQVSLAKLLGQILTLSKEFNIEVQPQFTLLQKTMVMAEGTTRQINPDINMWNLSRPLIDKWIDEADDPFKVLEEWIEKNKIVLLKIPEIIEKFDEFISKK